MKVHLGQDRAHQQRRCAGELRAIVMAMSLLVMRDSPCHARSSPSQAATVCLAVQVDKTSSSFIINRLEGKQVFLIDIQDLLVANNVI